MANTTINVKGLEELQKLNDAYQDQAMQIDYLADFMRDKMHAVPDYLEGDPINAAIHYIQVVEKASQNRYEVIREINNQAYEVVK